MVLEFSLKVVIEKGKEPTDKEMLKVYDGYNLECERNLSKADCSTEEVSWFQ